MYIPTQGIVVKLDSVVLKGIQSVRDVDGIYNIKKIAGNDDPLLRGGMFVTIFIEAEMTSYCHTYKVLSYMPDLDIDNVVICNLKLEPMYASPQ